MVNLGKLQSQIISLRQRSKEAIRSLLGFLYVKVYLGITLFINLIGWLISFTIIDRVSQDQAVLHYNVDFGVNLYGDVGRLYFIPLLGLIVLLVNLVVISNLNKQLKFAIHILLTASLLTNLFLLISQASLYFINLR